MAAETVTIRFEGKNLTCHADTTVAVALWENGVRHLSHSPKYGRPRGVTCARGQCTACLMRVDGVPNVRVCETPVAEGMTVERQDAGTFYAPLLQKSLEAGGPIFPVGFYYKWFTKPASLSRFFLSRIRPMTGVGRLPDATPTADTTPAVDLGRYATVVVGAGPSGLAAAAAAEGPVLLIDDHDEPGGQRHAAMVEISDAGNISLNRFTLVQAACERMLGASDQVALRPDIEFRGGWRAIAGFAPDGLLLRHGDQLARVACDRLVWAAGGLDTLGLFAGNDTPGLIGPRALYRLVTRDGLDLRDKKILLVGGGLDLWLSACLLAARGARLGLVVTESGWHSEVSAAVDHHWQLTTGLHLAEVKASGSTGIEATFTPEIDAAGAMESHLRLQADLAVVCNRPKPAYDIPLQIGAKLVLKPEAGGYVPDSDDAAAYHTELSSGLHLSMVGEACGALARDQILAGHQEETA